MKKYHLLFITLWPLGLFAQNNLYYPPLTGTVWEQTAPGALGFCPDRIDSLYQFLEATDTKSFMLLKDGKIVLEKYFGTYTRDSFWYWASAGKSLSAFLVGQAKDEGLLQLDDKTSQYLGAGWTNCPPEKEDLITIWHQISMTSGLDDLVPDDNCTDPSCLVYKSDAGTRWAYHNAPYHLVHDVLESASGLTLQQFTKTRLLDKTGMRGLWINHVQYGRARDMARFGLLMLGNGVWNGDTLLHDQAYLQAMTQPSQNMNPSYGYLWWLNGQSTYLLPGLQIPFAGPICPNAPSDMYAALGKNDQKIHVVPSKGWVVVRQGNSANVSLVPIVFDNQMWGHLNALDCAASATDRPEATLPVLSISPTIAGDAWTLYTEQPLAQATLYHPLGAPVRTWTGIQSQAQLNVETVAAGWYYLLVRWENGAQRVLRVGVAR